MYKTVSVCYVEINLPGLDNYQVPTTMAMDPSDHDSTDPSDSSEASDSDFAVSLEEEIID